MEKAASWWNELPSDFQTEICARLPVEFVYSYRMICKQWNGFLSSNYFLSKWSEAPLNRNQARLVLCDLSMTTPCIAFCFYTRNWIYSSFDFSFLKGGEWQQIRYFKQSVVGLVLVANMEVGSRPRLSNPYTRTFVEIPAPHVRSYLDCVVVDEKHNDSSAYKVVAVGFYRSDEGIWQQSVEIYEPSQKRWKIAGYLPDNFILQTSTDLIYYNGAFYTYFWEGEAGGVGGIASFTIPLEEGSGSAAITTIPLRYVPFPREFKGYQHLPRMITCGSRLLLISDVRPCYSTKLCVWEFKFNGEEGHPVPLSNSPAWEWVEIAQMPSSLYKEWIRKNTQNRSRSFLRECCIGVGDHVCFTSSVVVDVIAYNLIDNTWSWLPSCRCAVAMYYIEDARYGAIAVEPNPRIKLQ